MSRDSIPKTFYFDAEADVSIIVDVHPPRTEECHGIHTFDESEEIDRELLSFKVRVGENEIDFTSRLTPEEKKLIVESKEDV